MARAALLIVLATSACTHNTRVQPATVVVPSVSMPPLWIMSENDPLMGEVRFARNSTEPLALSGEELERVASSIRGSARLELIGVSGHAEQDEPDGLARNRAAKVIALLVARGVDGARLEVHGARSTAPMRGGVCGTGELPKDLEDFVRAEDRWVRFTILRSHD